MRQANGRESRLLDAVFRVVLEQPDFRIIHTALVARSICSAEEIDSLREDTNLCLVTAQCVADRSANKISERGAQESRKYLGRSPESALVTFTGFLPGTVAGRSW